MAAQTFFNHRNVGPQRVLLVVDTPPLYSGNYERAMTAYVTGLVGECGTGQNLAALAHQEDPELCLEMFHRLGSRYPDWKGVVRTCTIYPTPGYFNVSGDIYPDSEWDQPHVRRTYQARCRGERRKPGKLIRSEAYCSTAMFLADVPEPELLKRMVRRVLAFPAVTQGKWWLGSAEMTIAGIRLVREVVVTEQVTTCFPPLEEARRAV